jgi:hypothetical protein
VITHEAPTCHAVTCAVSVAPLSSASAIDERIHSNHAPTGPTYHDACGEKRVCTPRWTTFLPNEKKTFCPEVR